uniref:Uncharacterized protein n=1 Tax=Dactylella tenuis TaxID=383872 RepID=A0A4Y5MZ69_9PEZI|nr:hypothetical protein [Dactylella tenuis]QCW06865.1 hypothetical protein [Dactylella tenuis]
MFIKNSKIIMSLVQIFPSERSIGANLNFLETFYQRIKVRNNGWYKNTIFFCEEKLDNCVYNIISLLEFNKLIKELYNKKREDPKVKVRVTNVITNESVIYPFMDEVKLAIDHKGIKTKAGTSKLYKKINKF